MPDLNIFSERLKEARQKAKLTQKQLAELSDVTAATISSYESEGGTKVPSLDKVIALAKALNVSIDWLCGIETKKESYEDISSENFLKSLVNALMETSCEYVKDITIDGQLCSIICYENKLINNFIRKAYDVIKIYRDGTLSKDLFEACIDKLLSDYKYYEMFCNAFLDSDEYYAAVHDIQDFILRYYPEVGPGIYKTNLIVNPDHSRAISFQITDDIIEYFIPKREATDNAQHNPKEE